MGVEPAVLSRRCWTALFEDIDLEELQPAACTFYQWLRPSCSYWLLFLKKLSTVNDVTKYRSTPVFRYFCDGVLHFSIARISTAVPGRDEMDAYAVADLPETSSCACEVGVLWWLQPPSTTRKRRM